MAEPRAGGVATDAVDAVAAQAIGTEGANNADFLFAARSAITRLRRSRTSTDVVLPECDVRARSDGAHEITGLARSSARSIAAKAVDAETVQTFGVVQANFANHFLARTRAIAGLVCPGAHGNTIVVVQARRRIRARTEGAHQIAGFAGAATSDVATDIVETLTADAFGAGGTRNAILVFANAGRVTCFRVSAYVRRDAVLACRERRARTQVRHDVAGTTRRIACAGAANAIDAEVAHALANGRATLPVDFLAKTIAIARIDARAAKSIYAGLGNVRTRPDGARHIAGFAVRAATNVTAIAVHAVAAQAVASSGHANRAIGLFASTRAITYRAASLAARKIHRLGRIRRNAQYAAIILRALIVVDGFVGDVGIDDDVAHAIAFPNFAIQRDLEVGRIRTGKSKTEAALLVDTRARLAKVVNAFALAGHGATNTDANRIADEHRAAGGVLHLEWIRRSAVGADIIRTLIVVVGQIGIEVLDGRPAIAITYGLFAVAGNLREDWFARRGKRLTAHVVDTSTRLAIVVRRKHHAISGLVALHASALPIAHFRITADTRYA